MKRALNVFLAILILGFATQSSANTVTIDLTNVFSLGIQVASMQMDFLPNYDFPFLSDDNDAFAPNDFTIQKDFGNAGAISWHSAMMSNWYVEPLEDYNDATGIARADGLVVYSASDNSQFALHDGIVASLTSMDSIFRIDIGTIDLFNFVDTAHPITGLFYSEVIDVDTGDQIVTISGAPATVPIPGAVWLLGSGLLGLVAVRRRRTQG